MISFIDCYINDPTFHSINEYIENFPQAWSYHSPSQFGMDSIQNLNKRSTAIESGKSP